MSRIDRSSMLLIVIISIGVYANTLRNGFVYDDIFTIVDNPLIKDLNNLPRLFKKDYFTFSTEIGYRPAVTFTYFIDYALYGLNPWGYHLTNSLFHAINGVLLYIFLVMLIRPPTVGDQRHSTLVDMPLLVSILFAIHPVLTEAVNGISFREDLLVLLFYMATLILYLVVRSSRPQPQAARILLYLLSCATYLLSLFSKEMAVTLPLIAVCYEWVFAGNKGERERLPLNLYIMGYIAVTLIYIYIRFDYFQNPGGSGILQIAQQEYLYGGTLRVTALTMATVVAYYIRLLLLPVNLCADYYHYGLSYDIDPGVITAILLVTVLLITALSIRKRYPLASLGILFFFLALLPVSNIIPMKNLMAERYLYLPSVGFFLALADITGYAAVRSRRRYGLILLLMVATACFSALTYKRNFVWRDHYPFWADVVKKMPRNSRAHYNLAQSTSDQGERIRELRMALYLNPTKDTTRYELAWAYFLAGDYGIAIELYLEILRRDPDNRDVLNDLAGVYSAKGENEKAKDILERLEKLERDTAKNLF